MQALIKHLLRLSALVASWMLCAGAHAAVIDIDNQELAKLLGQGIPLVDIRTAPEWLQTGIVPGSRLLPFFDAQGQANPAAWLEKVRQIAKPGDPLIVICRTGNRTKAVSQFLSDKAGYGKVYNVRQGIVAWAQEGRSLTPVAQNALTCQMTNNC